MKFFFREATDNDDNFFEKYAVCGPPLKNSVVMPTDGQNGQVAENASEGLDNPNSGGAGARSDKGDNYEYLLR